MNMVMDPTRSASAETERRRGFFLIALSCLIGLVICLGMFTSASAATGQVVSRPAPGTATASQSHSATQGLGYWLVASDGGIFGEDGAPFRGSTGGTTLNKPIVGMAATPDGNGYWLVASDGGIFNYGDAAFSGSTGGMTLNKPIVGMAATPDGKGYWLVASDGGIFSYGDAVFSGSTGGLMLNKPIVGMAASFDGKGYYLVASDGGVFSYGDATFFGSTGGMTLNKPIVGMAVSGISGAASKLAFSTQPAGASGGTALSTQPTVTIQDAAGDPVTTDASTVTLAIAPGTPSSGGPGTLSACTSTGEWNGVFSFSGCAIDKAGTGYKLIATDGERTSATSAPFTVGTGPASQLAFTTEPAAATGGSVFGTQPTVTIQDAGGNTVTTDTHPITLTLTTGPGTLSGCTSTTTAGVATFSSCSIDTAATGDVLSATDPGDALDNVSNVFDVTVGAPTQLVLTTEPGDAVANTPFGIQPVVTIEDAGGNTVATDANGITLAISSGSGTLSGCSATTTAGVASFSGCTINTPGSFILSATDATETLNGAGTSFAVSP
jgi:hypothetical protein